jgi:hypothetical protein
MTTVPSGAAQVLARFGDQTITCSPYALSKLRIDKSNCFLKIEDYMIVCIPYRFGFKKSLFIASLSMKELAFFKKFRDSVIGLSLSIIPKNGKSQEPPVKFFIRCGLVSVEPVKNRENTGIFEVDYKTTPDDLVILLGHFLDTQERFKIQYEDYGKTPVKMTPEIANIMGYNMSATVSAPNTEPKRIQLSMISSKSIEHLEAAGGDMRAEGSSVNYQLSFNKYRIVITGVVQSCSVLPNGIIRTVSNLPFSPELVEIIDDYWSALRSKQGNKAVS